MLMQKKSIIFCMIRVKKVYLNEVAGLSFINDKDAMPLIMEGVKKYPEEPLLNVF